MERESGDDYVRRLASFIHINERALGEAGFSRRARTKHPRSTDTPSLLNPLAWFSLDYAVSSSKPPKPVILSTDVHHLFYTLMRLEALGYQVGTLDVEVDNPSRPTTYVNIFTPQANSDALSLSSIRSSFSAVSNLSLGGGWWSRSELPSLETELKYIYSSFTKLPALSIHAPEKKVVTELLDDPPHNSALPLEVFKNIQILECVDVDPRLLLGWDRLSESLRSLKIQKSGLEDVSDIFIGAVIDDQARREGSASCKRCRRIPRALDLKLTVPSTRLLDAVIEDEDERYGESSSEYSSSKLSSLKWAFLKYLSLPDNSLTFFPVEPLQYLTSLTHLDLSSNLLVSIPSGLAALHNLISLNLSDNMIDSVLGIYQNLGQVLYLNLSHNRLESICGLERLYALERVDLRSNLIEDSAEVGRLATLPNISEIWVEGNPFVELEERYRTTCFDYFWREGKFIMLDGTKPSFYEQRSLSGGPSEQMSSTRPTSIAVSSPPPAAVGLGNHPSGFLHSPKDSEEQHASNSSSSSPHLSPTAVSVSRPRRRKMKRIVDLGGSHHTANSDLSSTVNIEQVEGPQGHDEKGKGIGNRASSLHSPSPPLSGRQITPPHNEPVSLRGGHRRHQTELIPSPRNSVTPANISTYLHSNVPFKASDAEHGTPRSLRRTRMSASVYEASQQEVSGSAEEIRDNADAYRRRIEALKQDMGEGWLKVLSQSQMRSPS
ncbi:hypothetical protein BDQ17DRAFT_1368038 [Cyathus striatus]|nr:hypothetical protein BDQ17DRAFT_1368038 [Cyathus striatus]